MTQTQQPEAAPLQMPKPVGWLHRHPKECKNGEVCNYRIASADRKDGWEESPVYTEQQVRAMLSTGVQAQAVPIGWREQFATEVYADLEAADNQDVPLEEYPARILKVLDSTVGPRHPVVIKWRNDAIKQCIAIAFKYCRDPESHKYLKQDLEAMLVSAPAHPAEGVPAQAAASTDQSRAQFDAWIRTHEEEHGAVDEASAWAAWSACSLMQAKQGGAA